MYKARKDGDEAKEELDKQLVAFENELKNQKFIGGEPFIFKQMINKILFCSQLSIEATSFSCSSKQIDTVEPSSQGIFAFAVYMMGRNWGGGGARGHGIKNFLPPKMQDLNSSILYQHFFLEFACCC